MIFKVPSNPTHSVILSFCVLGFFQARGAHRTPKGGFVPCTGLWVSPQHLHGQPDFGDLRGRTLRHLCAPCRHRDPVGSAEMELQVKIPGKREKPGQIFALCCSPPVLGQPKQLGGRRREAQVKVSGVRQRLFLEQDIESQNY